MVLHIFVGRFSNLIFILSITPREYLRSFFIKKTIRDFLSTFLQTRGYSTSTANDGEDALRLLHEDSGFGVVLLDIMMPQKGGMEVLSEVRRFKRRPAVIMMTALADASIAQQALKQGAFNYILKPLNLPELESNVSACFGHPQYYKNRRFRTKGGAA